MPGEGTAYFFSLCSPVFAWAATVFAHAWMAAAVASWRGGGGGGDDDGCDGGVTAPAALPVTVLAAIAEAQSLRAVALFWTLQRLVRAHKATLRHCFDGVHEKLMEERYRVGWQLHNFEQQQQQQQQ